MIRIVRTYTAKQGRRREVVDALREVSQYAATQGINIRVLYEPWGNSRRVHIHTDYEEADMALRFIDEIYFNNPRGVEAVQRVIEMTEGDEEVTFLTT